ncbi:hypothetical protein EZS27_028121, partial [termite gut metagenome]
MKIIARRNFAFYFIIGKIKNIAG